MKRTLSIFIALLLLSPLSFGAGIGKPFFRNWTAMEYGGHNRNFDIVCDGTGRVFVANFEGLAIYDGTQWEIIHTPGISRVTSLFVSGDGRVIFGGNNVLGYVEPGGKTATYIADDTDVKVRFGEITKIRENGGAIRFITSSGQLWSVENDGIAQVEGNDAELIPGTSDFSYSMQVAGSAIVAKASTGEGLTISGEKGQIMYTLTSSDGLCSDNVNAMAYDGKGSLWGATDNGLFVVNLSPVFTQYTKSDGLSGQVTDILLHEGKLYVGTLQGLFILGKDNRFSRIGDISLACWQLATGEGSILAATAQGLYEIREDTAQQLNTRHTLCVIHDKGSVWYTGELNGIYRHSASQEDRRVADIPNTERFSKDSKGSIWAISLGNETFCKKAGSEQFVAAENKDMTLLFRFTDSFARTWQPANNNQGLYCNELSEREREWFEPLSKYEIHAMELGGDRIWLGGNFGLICMNSEKMEDTEPFAPALHIRSFKQSGSDVSISFANDKIDAFGKTLYSYRMREDAEWTPWSEVHSLNFSNMMSGDYRFCARSVDAYGTVAESRIIEFNVPRPFYLRWYAIVLYIILLSIMVGGIFMLRIYQAKLRQRELEAQVKERTSQLEAAQSALIKQEREATVGKLTKGLIDRILNPMNYINNFSHLTLGLVGEIKGNVEQNKEKIEEDDYEDSLDILDMMNSNLSKIEAHGMSTTRILKAMEELLKDRKGKVEETNLNNLCQHTIEVFSNYFADDVQKYGIDIECKVCEQEVSVEIVAEQFENVLKCILGNSMYAIRKKNEKQAYKGLIRLTLANEDVPVIKIYDNGIGIEDSIKDKVFDPFFTTKPTGEAPGIGLYLSQQIIQDAGGSISFESRKDEYTEFSIRLK